MVLNNNTVSELTQGVYQDIRDFLFASEPLINSVLDSIFTNHGKGVRPVFMALVGEIFNTPWDKLRKAAMIIEAIHVASLIHDDVIDASDLRRGMATLNVKYSDKISVLFGDFVFIKALNSAHELNGDDIVRVVHEAVERMLAGEIREELTNGNINEGIYLSIIADKTASLFAASAEITAILSGAESSQIKLARELGETIGVMFQIVDDTLDFVGETDVMGKPGLADITTGHYTLPVIHAMKDLSAGEMADIGKDRDVSVNKILDLMREKKSIDYARQVAGNYRDKAVDLISRLSDRDSTVEFNEFIDKLMTRDF